MLTIDKNIPMPKKALGRRASETTKTFPEMEVGDSIAIVALSADLRKEKIRLANLARAWSRRRGTGEKFESRVRQVGKTEHELRLWRIE